MRPLTRMLDLLLGLLIIQVFIGCCDLFNKPYPMTTQIVYGRYAANFGDRCYCYFDLLPDSILVYYFERQDELFYVDTCKWYITKETNFEYFISIYDCVEGASQGCGGITKDIMFTKDEVKNFEIKRTLNGIQIIYSKKNDWIFEKIPGIFKSCDNSR